MNKLSLAILLCSPFTVLNASEITGSGELGATLASGNTDVQTINAKLALDYEINEQWTSGAKLDILSSSSASVQTSEKYELDYQGNYKSGKSLYYFGALNARTDRFGGVKLSNGLTAGIGDSLIKTQKTTLTAQAGAGFRSVTDTANTETAEAIVTAALNYANKLSESTNLTTDISLESGSSNTFTKVDLGIEVKLDKDLALQYSIGSKTNSTVGAGIKNTDLLQTVNLVYGF